MLRRLLTAFLLAPAAALSLTGAYRQTHSNMYVQYTTEVDWKCVTVHVTADDDAMTLDVYKKARLHGGPVTVITPVQRALLGNNKFTVTTPLSSKFTRQTYDVHTFVNDTLVITGEETPSLYVWQRANSSAEPVDIPRLLAFLRNISFDVPDATYREITPTYDVNTCA